jgi:hypothetical protein
MSRSPLVLLSLGILVVLANGCAPASESEDEEASDSALTHSEVAAKDYEAPELLLDKVAPSPSVAKLGVKSWTVYSAAKDRFVGLVMMATDANADVKYGLLVRAKRGADGRLDIAAFQLDKAGRDAGPVDKEVVTTLIGDVKPLQSALAERSRKQKNTARQDCTIGIAQTFFSVILAAAGTVVVAKVAAAVLVAEAGSVLTALVTTGQLAGNLAVLGPAYSVISEVDTWRKIERCFEPEK